MTAIHDFAGQQTYTEKPGHRFILNANFSEVDATKYDALVVLDGRAPEYLRMNSRMVEITRHFLSTNKPLASICHDAQLLASTGMIKGRKLSAYPACQIEVELAGGEYMGIAVDSAVTDNNLATAPGLARAPGLAFAVPRRAGHAHQLVGFGQRKRQPAASLPRHWGLFMCKIFISADPASAVCHSDCDLRKPMDSRGWLGANHSDARRHREDLQRRHAREDTVLCRNESDTPH